MTDTLKVFTNQTNQTASTGLGTVSIPLTTTNSSTKAVIRDVAVSIRNTNASYSTSYNYPTKLKVNGAAVSDSADGTSTFYNGSLVLDTSTSLTLEIQPEEQAIDYGTIRIMIPNAGAANTYYEAQILTSPSGNGLALAEAAEAGRSNAGGAIYANTGTGFFKSGVPYVAYGNNSNTVNIIDTTGVTVASVNVGATITAVASDATYIYCHGPQARTYIRRIRISDFQQHSNLNLDANFPSYSTSNPGWFDHYDGHVYMRHSGSASEVYKVNTSTGANTNFNTGHSTESEHIGGRITVATDGTPYIVEWQDKRFFAYNLSTNTLSNQYTATSYINPWTEPTTTSGNHSATLAPGIVLFRNGSYDQCALVDVNSGDPAVTLLTTVLPMGSSGTNRLMVGFPHQTAPVNIPRTIQYDTYVGGVEVT